MCIRDRHRDIRFDGKSNADDAPISMIITVLAAYLYNHNANLFHALADITKKLTAYSQLLTERYDVLALSESTRDYHIISRTPDGIWHLNNPVADENFAERWHENGNRKAKAFFQWSNWIYEDIVRPIENGNVASFYNTCRMLIPDLESRLNSFPSTIQQALQRNIQYIRALPPRSFFFQRQRKELIYPIVLDTDCRVKVECLATKSGWRSINYCNNGSPLPKGYSLKFTAQTNVKHPDCVLWQVVNTGEEAEKAHCLRGDFYNNETVDAYTGGYVRKESTSYTGKHWIECFIIKNQKCVARSGEFVVNIQ